MGASTDLQRRVRQPVGELITGENPKILIDFTDIDFFTSAGLRALLVLYKKARASGSVFALCGVNEQVREVLDISGFTPISAFIPTVRGHRALSI